MGTRAVIYVRHAAHNTDGVSIALQEEKCRQYAADHNLEVVDVYSDDDDRTGAIKPGRPGFEGLIARVRAGGVDAVITSSTDRLARRRGDLTRLRDGGRLPIHCTDDER